MISSLLHLVGLRPRVYYTLINSLAPPLNTPMVTMHIIIIIELELCEYLFV